MRFPRRAVADRRSFLCPVPRRFRGRWFAARVAALAGCALAMANDALAAPAGAKVIRIGGNQGYQGGVERLARIRFAMTFASMARVHRRGRDGCGGSAALSKPHDA